MSAARSVIAQGNQIALNLSRTYHLGPKFTAGLSLNALVKATQYPDENSTTMAGTYACIQTPELKEHTSVSSRITESKYIRLNLTAAAKATLEPAQLSAHLTQAREETKEVMIQLSDLKLLPGNYQPLLSIPALVEGLYEDAPTTPSTFYSKKSLVDSYLQSVHIRTAFSACMYLAHGAPIETSLCRLDALMLEAAITGARGIPGMPFTDRTVHTIYDHLLDAVKAVNAEEVEVMPRILNGG